MNKAYEDALKVPVVFPRRSVTALNRLETRNWDLIASTVHCQDDHALEALREQLREMTGRRHIFFAPSARCAIARVLSALSQAEVVVPAFTCEVVRKAVELAGKRIVYVDIDRTSLNAKSCQYTQEARHGRILLPTHLFGIPTDIVEICDLARERGCVTIEDAAGAYPARLGSRLLGTFGDVGIISFERSKRVPSFRGAAIILNNDKAVDITKLCHPVVGTTNAMPICELLFSIAYNFGTIPWFYGRFAVPRILRTHMARPFPNTVPSPSVATSDPFYSREFHPYQAALVTRVLKRIGAIREHIRRLVEIYQHAFRDTAIQSFVVPGCDTGGLLRFPVVFPGRERSDVLRAALRRGLFLETNYEQPLPDETEHAAFPNSSWAAQNLVLLPLYTSLSEDAATRLASQIINIEHETAPRLTAEPPVVMQR